MSSKRATLTQLEDQHEFQRRHIGPDAEQTHEMLAALGHDTLEALIDEAVPPNIRSTRPLALPGALTEREALARLGELAQRNQVLTSMIGMGYYGTLLPGVIQRNVLENPGWYTAYTPYQAEVSQGRMEVLLSYQQMVTDLTGMQLANASLLDEATAAAEAMAMARRVNRKSRSSTFLVDADSHPQTVAVLQTRARALGIEVVVGEIDELLDAHSAFAILLSFPGSSGAVKDPGGVIERAHDSGALVVVASDLLALALLKSPGEMGADMVVGSAQRFGVPMGYGGPHAAFFATRDEYKRSMPGRVIGVSVDTHGRQALRMALQTREQHIRREKATSNICTAQVLLAVIAALYACYHGPDGIRRIAQRVARLADHLAAALKGHEVSLVNESWFDTLTVRVPGQAQAIAGRALEQGINLRIIDDDHLGMSVDETTTRKDIGNVLRAFGVQAPAALDDDAGGEPSALLAGLPESLQRESAFLQHPVFNSFHSETEMLRYLRRLQAKDVALDRSMIPLGSCTMKLNATTEMVPVTWPGFGALHPFAPLAQARGYLDLFAELEQWLCEITGFDAVSLQPNAGSQGEYAGLLAIRRYHESRGDAHRQICLIPSSAHGTNPASAVMAGMQVVVVACDRDGNVDVEDLRAKAAKHKDELSALMITYPSTHGVFETAVNEVCEIIHEHGGQVYLDGANLNALVGLARLAEIGADVSHMNLHKTFCIPHGGGGPGMGPIGVRQHLAAFLPDHPVVPGVNPHAGSGEQAATIGTVSAAPWGSASILPISWAYIAMMGPDGLTHATSVAILVANYVAFRLRDHFPIVYTGNNGRVAHECIIDLRAIKDSCGVSVDDVAKRLVDFGIHAPTMSWPVHDTMMIEPTESESLRELDRFCDAMITIRREIAAIEAGDIAVGDSALRHAPHTHHLLLENWDRAYSREEAFFPGGAAAHSDKYWPPVGRVDNVYGDKNLVCACPPMEAYLS